MGYRRIRPGKIPIKRDENQAQHFKENFKIPYDNLEVWYYDETGIQGDSALREVWSRRGERSVCYYRGTHISESVPGAANPKTGAFESFIMPHVNKDIFQKFLDHFNKAPEAEPS